MAVVLNPMMKQQAPTLFKSSSRWSTAKKNPMLIVRCLLIIPLFGILFLLSHAIIDDPTTTTVDMTSTTTTKNSEIQHHHHEAHQNLEENRDTDRSLEAAHSKHAEEPPPRIDDNNQSNKDDGADDKRLPLATSLLDKSPPFEESDILKLSSDMTTSPNTVVTAYFRVPSKFKPGKYDGWMKNFLSLQDHMVIFTQPELVEQIKSLRKHALDRTVIILMNLDNLPIGTLFSQEFWQDQLERDPEKGIHRSYQLFWIWLSKSWCVTEAIKLNFFQSDLFVWSDIGCFRDGSYNTKTMIQHRDQVPPNEMIQMAHHKPNPPKEDLFNDKYKRKPNFYHSGSQFAAYKDTWITFHKYFLETIDRFLEKNMIIVEDQAVLQSVCLSHPESCAYVPFSEVKDNHYFGLRYVLHHGGNFKLWRYKKENMR